MKKTTLALLATLTLAMPATASSSTYWSDHGWLVTANELSDGTPYCRLMAVYDDETSFAVNFMPLTNDASVGFILPVKEAANFSPEKTYEISVNFVDGKKLDDGWRDRNFTVVNSSDNISRIFMSSEMEAEVFMNDVSEATTVGFWMYDNTRFLISFELGYSGQGIKKLRECGYSRMID